MSTTPATPFVSLTQIPQFSPEAAEVLGVDDHLPSIALERLHAPALQSYFADPPVWTTPIHEPPMTQRVPAPASVLLGIVMRHQPMVLLTLRTAHLSNHSGQIAFPGGRQDAQDADETAAALREAQEEVGLHPQFVQVLGCLPLYVTGTGFKVTPVVALIDPAMRLQANPHEVAEVFEVPLLHLMNPANHRRHAVEWQGVRREWFSMPYQDEQTTRMIWGVTAGILRNFYQFLQAKP
jgi:8-oxo-dGTP pyrophosphatase MutT (NUDIX family)